MKLRQLLFVALLAAGSGGASASPNDVIVSISNFTFKPSDLHVKVGTTVTFKNEDDIPHRVAATDGSFYSKALDTDDIARVTFKKAGVVPYFCTLHPHMQGKIIVTP
jgi:plastocyanin